jgi:hypothetical protein
MVTATTFFRFTRYPGSYALRPCEAVHDLALPEGKRGEYVSQLLRTSLAAQTFLSPVRVTVTATTFFRIARCPKILALFIAWQNHHDWYPFLSGREVNMFRDYLEIHRKI